MTTYGEAFRPEEVRVARKRSFQVKESERERKRGWAIVTPPQTANPDAQSSPARMTTRLRWCADQGDDEPSGGRGVRQDLLRRLRRAARHRVAARTTPRSV
eukprot:62682-Rhodomonas_salina.1